jgi:hypothetical protein
MDDGIAACKDRERLRTQQAMSIGNRANGSHQTIEVALASCQSEPQHGARGANCKMLPEAKHGTLLPAAPAEAPRPTFQALTALCARPRAAIPASIWTLRFDRLESDPTVGDRYYRAVDGNV